MVGPSSEAIRRSFGRRLHQALDRYKETRARRGRAAWLAQRFRVSPQAAQKWLNGEALPDMAHLAALCVHLKIRVDWLFTGEGPMYIEEKGAWPFAFDRERYDRLNRLQKHRLEALLVEKIIEFEEHDNHTPKPAGKRSPQM